MLECRELGERYTSLTSDIECREACRWFGDHQRSTGPHHLERPSLVADQSVHKIAKCVGWKKIWDRALDHGP